MELAEPFDMTQPAISRHLKVLEGAGLITAPGRWHQAALPLAPDGVAEIDQWLAMLRKALPQLRTAGRRAGPHGNRRVKGKTR